MTTLYKPVLIESVEQAEALPVGTIAVLPDGLCHRQILTKTNNGPGPWEVDMHGYPHVALLGWTALVPIEAEEETRDHPHRDEERAGYVYHQPVQQVRYKTRWETA